MKEPLTHSQMKRIIQLLEDENFHHRIPQSLGGGNVLGTVEVVNIRQHVLWHKIFGANNAQVTAGIAQDLLDYEGWGDKIRLVHKKTGQEIPLVRGKADLTLARFYAFREFRDFAPDGTLSSFVEMVNTTWNDPRCEWVAL